MLAEYLINAIRAARGLYLFEHSDALDENETYGTKVYAMTMALSDACTHGADEFTKGPLMGTSNIKVMHMAVAGYTNPETGKTYWVFHNAEVVKK